MKLKTVRIAVWCSPHRNPRSMAHTHFPFAPVPHEASVGPRASCPSLSDPVFFRRTLTWITALYHVPWAAEVSLEAWMTLRRRMTTTVGTAPEEGAASPVGFLMKSFKCKYWGHGNLSWQGASRLARLVKNPPAMWGPWVWSLGWEDPLEEGMATHSSILAWRIPWTVYCVGRQRVRYNWVAFTHSFTWVDKSQKWH